jgi:hypothetical protein
VSDAACGAHAAAPGGAKDALALHGAHAAALEAPTAPFAVLARHGVQNAAPAVGEK